jgi:hypothetical protein
MFDTVCNYAVPSEQTGDSNSTFECACAKGCTTDDCGVWKAATTCSCNTGCACGGFFPMNFQNVKFYDNIYFIGVTPKGADASKCSVYEMFDVQKTDKYYYQLATVNIGPCAGAN